MHSGLGIKLNAEKPKGLRPGGVKNSGYKFAEIKHGIRAITKTEFRNFSVGQKNQICKFSVVWGLKVSVSSFSKNSSISSVVG